MSESDKGKSKDAGGDSDCKKPRGASAELESSVAGEKRQIEARADWIVLRKDDEPSAEMFFVSYLEKTGEHRPLEPMNVASLRVSLTESNGQYHPMIFHNDKTAIPM